MKKRVFKVTAVLPLPKNKEYNTPSPQISDKVKCKNCRKYFCPENNGKCYYHPGKLFTDGLKTDNNYDEAMYSCCGQVEKGFFPTLVPVIGCKVNDFHVSNQEDEKHI